MFVQQIATVLILKEAFVVRVMLDILEVLARLEPLNVHVCYIKVSIE